MDRSTHNPWLNRFAVLTAAATLVLICAGGLVTSHGVGLSVPDWPTTYGYNMFFFPVSKWMGGIFYEHTHRLWASLVGMLTAALAGWIWARENRGTVKWIGLGAIAATLGLMGVRTQGMFVALACVAACVIAFSLTRLKDDGRPIRWWAAIAFSAVLVQGVLGGLRVTALKDELGIFHATLAQLFFAVICAIALFTSRSWEMAPERNLPVYVWGRLQYAYAFAVGMILLQLILGATMRHQHAGLAVPDFPLAYGNLWPDLDAASIARYNQLRGEVTSLNPITAAQIVLQMVHRLVAILIVLAVLYSVRLTHKHLGWRDSLTRICWLWLGLILVQIGLGAATIWTSKSADLATAHVATGALSLVAGAILLLMVHRAQSAAPVRAASSVAPAEERRLEQGAAPSHA